jgi:type I restriction enzyme S subunit
MTYPRVPLSQVLTPVSRLEPVDPQQTYNILGAHWYAQGLYTKDTKSGAQIRASELYRVEQGDFVYNRLFAWRGSFAVATSRNHGCHVSNEFLCFTVNTECVDSQYLWRYFSRPVVWDEALNLSTGSTPTSRNRLKIEPFLALQIPLPPLDEQCRVVEQIEKNHHLKLLYEEAVTETDTLLQVVLDRAFKGEL